MVWTIFVFAAGFAIGRFHLPVFRWLRDMCIHGV